MKRFLIIGALMAALLIPATALGVTHALSGTVNPSGTINMKYHKKPSGKRTVTDLMFADIPITCNDGAHLADGNTTGFVFHVNNQRQFGATLSDGGGGFLGIHGKLNRRGTRASGTIRLHGKVVTHDGRKPGCDTGTDDWSAHT